MEKSRKIHLIEFGGIPGSAKSTLFKLTNNYLFDRLNYYPGPFSEWNGILNDLPLDGQHTKSKIPARLNLLLNFLKAEKKWLLNKLAKEDLSEESLIKFHGLIFSF